MNTYTGLFRFISWIGELDICVSSGEYGENETSIPKGFLFAHGIEIGDKFVAEVDYGGKIILETIRKIA